MKTIICTLFVSMALVACTKGEVSATRKNSVAIDKVDGNIAITYNNSDKNVVTTGNQSPAIGSAENVNITYNDSSASLNKELEIKNNSVKQIAIATGKNSVAMNSTGDISVDNDSQVVAMGDNSVSIVNGKGFINGKELDMDLSHGVSISYNGNDMLINGQKPKFKK